MEITNLTIYYGTKIIKISLLNIQDKNYAIFYLYIKRKFYNCYIYLLYITYPASAVFKLLYRLLFLEDSSGLSAIEDLNVCPLIPGITELQR